MMKKEGGLSSPPNGGLENPPSFEQKQPSGGQECPPSVPSHPNDENPPTHGDAFLNPHAEIDRHGHRLPHWQQGDVCYFVTWHLADALPQEKLKQWRHEKECWLRLYPQPWDEKTQTEYLARFSGRIDEGLDASLGLCLLREAKLAKVVADSLLHFDGQRYDLSAFVVMPNHVHVLFRLRETHRLEQVVQSWKGFTASELNRRTGRHGALWQEGYWDRMIRNARHFDRCLEYLRANPTKAKLPEKEFICWEKKEGGLSSPPGGGLENPPLP
jgi:REP element-mobilizing transposase RayT